MSTLVLSDHQKKVHETSGRVVTKKVRFVDLGTAKTGRAALTDLSIWKPAAGEQFILLAVYSKCRSKNGTVSAARVNLQVANSDVVSSAAPAVAVGAVVTHTVVASKPFTFDAPLDLTTTLSTGTDGTGDEAGGSGLEVDLILVAVQTNDIFGN